MTSQTPGPGADAPARRAADDDHLFPIGAARLLGEGAVVAAVAWVWAVLNYRLWDISPHVPVHSTDDARLITNLVKNVADHGWWTSNPDLGYPVGQQLYDFPHGGETWQMVLLRIMSTFTDSPGLLMNLYFFGGIGITAVAAFLALRHLRFSFGLSLVAGVALTWLPFRIGHSQYHLFRTSFWWVPLAVVVLLWVLHWRERFLRDPDPPPRDGWRDTLTWTLRSNLRRRRVAVFAAMVLVLGMSETMTTAFTLTLLGLTGVVAAIRRREPATLLVHGTAIVAIAVVFFVGLSSTLRFQAEHGVNPDAGRRKVIEQELYGLKIADMLLPDPSHRWESIGEPMREVRTTSRIPSEGGQSIGILGAIGFLGAAIHVLTRGWGEHRRDRRALHDRTSLRSDTGLLAVLATLVATVAGGAMVLSILGFSQVRVWNRMSLIIGTCSMIFALTWLEGGWARVRERMATTPARDRPWTRQVVGTALVAVLVAGVLWDGAHVRFRPPDGSFGLDYERNDAAWVADADYAAALDAALPDGSAVFQLPIIRFPEAPPPGRMKDYDHLRGWIHLPPGRLRWSYGAMKGRPDGDWQLLLRSEIGEVGSLPYLIGLGFDGIWLDTWGYDDADRLRAELQEVIGGEPIVSADQRVVFWDLAPLKERLAAEGRDQAALEAEARELLGVEPGDGP